MHQASRETKILFLSQLGDYKVSTRTLYERGWRERRADARKKGERRKYVGSGRFSEKGTGQQVGNAIEEASVNEKIKAIYGNFNLWSWLRYWYLDTRHQTLLMIVDKSYYDYDYDRSIVEKRKRSMEAKEAGVISEENLAALLSTAINPFTGESINSEINDVKNIQNELLNELN